MVLQVIMQANYFLCDLMVLLVDRWNLDAAIGMADVYVFGSCVCIHLQDELPAVML